MQQSPVEERLLALGIQQKEDYVNVDDAIDSLVDKLDQIINFVSGISPF